MKILRTRNELAVKALFKAIFPVDDYDLPKKSIHWIVYDSSNMPIGFCSCYKLAYENAAFLALAGILKEHRGKGYHKKMIDSRVNWAKKNKFDAVITYTEKNNYNSFENLQDCKFRLYIPDYKFAGETFLYWIKYL